MAKNNKRIEIVVSSESGLSSMGAASREGLLRILSMHYADAVITFVRTESDLRALVERAPDLVFLGMKFIPRHPEVGLHDPEKIWIAEYLERHDILFTGSGPQAHKLERTKQSAKLRVIEAGLPTPRFRVLTPETMITLDETSLTYPLFIKPTDRGGGAGVDTNSVAHTAQQAHAKVQKLHDSMQTDSLVEEYLHGREFSVAILRNPADDSHMLMPIELIAPLNDNGQRFLSSQVKSADTEQNAAVTDPQLRAKINALALQVFAVLGGRDYGRIDIRLDDNGVPHFLEANLLPSLLDNYGNFPKSCMLNNDLGYEAMVLHIVDLAFLRDTNSPMPRQATEVVPQQSLLDIASALLTTA